MLRRSAIAVLFAAGRWARARGASLAPCFEGAHGTAVVADAQSGRLIAVHAPELAAGALAPPGSTLKPFVLASLIETRRLSPDERFRCPGDLRIGGRSLACSHPPVTGPMDARSALSYSCNCFVAHFAQRFERAELPRVLERYGLVSRSGWFGETEAPGELRPADVRLQALGEEGVLATAAGLARAYRRLAMSAPAPVLAGLEDAVEYGTAQRASVAGWKIAGKTGTVVAPDGARLAWFAGFAPARSPAVVVAVMLQGRSGGTDAAPIAGRILDACRKGPL